MKAHDKDTQFKMMTQMSTGRLVLKLGLPTTISMLVTTIYNMADTYFVSSLGTSQSGATGIVFGLMAIIQAVGFTYGHGAGSNIGRLLGAGRTKDAGKYASSSVFFGLITGLVISVVGLSLHTPLMNLLGSTNTILPFALEYSLYILLAAPVMVLCCILNNILRYEGKATFAMFGLVSGGLINILGDFLLIKVFDMGVPGAGISTALSQCISVVILIVPFLSGKTQSKLSIKNVFSKNNTDASSEKRHFSAPDALIIGSILAIGLPSLMRQGLGSISTMILNASANPFGDAAIAGMSIASKVVNFIFCVGLGIGQGFQPVAGFNYGARKYSRVKSAYRFTLLLGMVLLGTIGIAGCLLAEPIIAAFRNDPDVVAVGVPALRYQAAVIFLMPIQVTTNMMFQSTGKSVRATLLSATRSGLFFIPTILILSRLMGLAGIECSQAIADVLASLMAIPFAIHFLRSLPEDN
ncbi:MAG: MATE family efflux transporter [Lachnospiraceae bacterium]|nr:MATE family efflux transporter [Lachnospiraceae bacterium]